MFSGRVSSASIRSFGGYRASYFPAVRFCRLPNPVKMSTYKGQTPSDLQVDPRIVPFFERFYAVSDDPEAHEEYAQSFVPNADFAMGAKKTVGYDGILELRHGLWTGPVKTRKHSLTKIFPFGSGSNELMLYGTVDYGLKNGKEVTVDWAARAVMAEHQGALKFKLYQVYVDSTPVANAAKE
ncbi:hypothetical protein PV11_06211 [Exophiala sideris]|uniref:SnoaL-like domain-containing protein n=2 Tax=Exophiala sideris TaxID=1016849 RepID=A0A0D1Y6T3_9EURO|nr:hypothetical protein PV11_06211 [Exophiala sideris]